MLYVYFRCACPRLRVSWGKIVTMRARWALVWVIWAVTAIEAVLIAAFVPHEQAFEWYGAVLAGSVATVALFHLVKASPEGIVRELIYVGGGSYLILALTSIYLFIRG
jgi:hypothetical protein